MSQLPASKIKVAGEIKAVELSLTDRLAAKIYLDKSIYFELDLNSTRSWGSSKPVLEMRKDKLVLAYRSPIGALTGDREVFRIGQDVSVFGKCQKAPGGKILIGAVEVMSGSPNW